MTKQILARLALIEVAVFWGMSWFGYRALHEMGMSGMSAGVATCVASALIALVWAARSLRSGSWRSVPLWLLVVMMTGAAVSGLAFTWGMVHGQVMRVMLLFYLMPVWTVIMAHWLLKEKTNWAGWVGVVTGLVGATTMLYDPKYGAPFPQTPAEWSGLAAGFGSAVLNITLRKTPQMDWEARSFFLSLGSVILGFLWLPFEQGPHLPREGAFYYAVGLVLLMGGLLFLTNRMYQLGMKYLTTHQAVVIFPFELVVGAVSSWLLANEMMTTRSWVGGGLILVAGLISSWWSEDAH